MDNNKPKPILAFCFKQSLSKDLATHLNDSCAKLLAGSGWVHCIVDGMDRNEVLAFMPDKTSEFIRLEEVKDALLMSLGEQAKWTIKHEREKA